MHPFEVFFQVCFLSKCFFTTVTFICLDIFVNLFVVFFQVEIVYKHFITSTTFVGFDIFMNSFALAVYCQALRCMYKYVNGSFIFDGYLSSFNITNSWMQGSKI